MSDVSDDRLAERLRALAAFLTAEGAATRAAVASEAAAEVERLRAERADTAQVLAAQYAEVETLRQRERDWLAGEHRIQAEVERLRAENEVLGDDRQVALLDKRHAEAEVERLRDACTECDSSLVGCLTAPQRGGIKCCPDCKHTAELAGWSALTEEVAALRARLDAVRALLPGRCCSGSDYPIHVDSAMLRAALGDEGEAP